MQTHQLLSDLLNNASHRVFVDSPAPWAGHIPFAMWLLPRINPKMFVELGSYSGISYFAICESVASNGLQTRCSAIDTWLGDEHAGFYSGLVFEEFKKRHGKYKHFSRYYQETFDSALPRFRDGSIDLLHIDGLHTYEAVKHDFETWQPKLTPNAIVLFHDIAVDGEGFGVNRYWCELKERFKTLEFSHSGGLGVLFNSEASYKGSADLSSMISSSELFESFCSACEIFGSKYQFEAQLIQAKADRAALVELSSRHDKIAVALANVENLRDLLTEENRKLRSFIGVRIVSWAKQNLDFFKFKGR